MTVGVPGFVTGRGDSTGRILIPLLIHRKTLATARTAGRSDWQSVGSDASPLSCFLFRPRKSCEKRRKRSHTKRIQCIGQYGLQGSLKRRYKHPSPTSINGYHTAKKLLSQSPAKRPTLLSRMKRVHTRLCSKDRTQRLTRRNRGRFGWGWYHYSRSVPHVHQHPRAGYQNGKFCRFWGLVGGAPKERRKPSGQPMRLCASLFRASRPRWAA